MEGGGVAARAGSEVAMMVEGGEVAARAGSEAARAGSEPAVSSTS